MPLYHSTALMLGFMPCLMNGATAAIGRRFSNKTYWPEVRASKATIIQYVGETCRYLLAAPPQYDPATGENLDQAHNVRLAFGNGMRPDVWQRFKERFGIETIAEFYGATEAPGASINMSSNDYSRGAIGKRGTLLSLLSRANAATVEIDWETEQPKRDPKNHNFCIRVPTNTPGELLFAVDAGDLETKYQGYWGNEKASSSKIMRDVLKKGDAWFRTGDSVRTDANGLTWFCDRIGDTFRWRSENVSTNEVSEVLGHHANITEANVYGVEVPNHDGRAGCAAITVNAPISEPLLQSLAQQATENLPKYAVPLFLRVMKEMTSTGNNKQQKHGLRQQGIDPAKVEGEDQLLWLKDGTYAPFGPEEFKQIEAGKVKL
jgi:acyl-CoA synthetase (AMP-forming)/AMP-acid ligase II